MWRCSLYSIYFGGCLTRSSGTKSLYGADMKDISLGLCSDERNVERWTETTTAENRDN